MKITLTKLNELKACRDGVEWFSNQKESELTPLCYALIDASHANWANWLVTKLMTHRQRVGYAIFAAEQVIDIFERRYPDDKRPRLAIDAAKNYLAVTKNKDAAYAASAYAASAYAAYAASAYAAYAAYAASAAALSASAAADAYVGAYAADASASAAAYAADAADADAYVAAYAADAAATSAAYAAAYDARKEMQIQIIDYGIKLLEEPTK